MLKKTPRFHSINFAQQSQARPAMPITGAPNGDEASET